MHHGYKHLGLLVFYIPFKIELFLSKLFSRSFCLRRRLRQMVFFPHVVISAPAHSLFARPVWTWTWTKSNKNETADDWSKFNSNESCVVSRWLLYASKMLSPYFCPLKQRNFTHRSFLSSIVKPKIIFLPDPKTFATRPFPHKGTTLADFRHFALEAGIMFILNYSIIDSQSPFILWPFSFLSICQ